ncbi:MAG: thiamine diphosphokinase [Oscillospiraceae bacterium]|nr:thiamine diphosphokinase [Oscillospiraceae bacterium]
MGECYIFAAGSYYGLWQRPNPDDFLIAADGGYPVCQSEGLRPDLVIGDFDSLPAPPDHPNVIRLPVEKDDTDLLAAIREGLRHGCTVFRLYGGTGGPRPEHTLANYQCLLFLAAHGARGYLYGDGYVVSAVRNGILSLPAADCGNVSVFALSGPAVGVTLRGLQYPLQEARLTPEMPLGVSNAFRGEPAEISVRSGTLLVFWDLPRRH